MTSSRYKPRSLRKKETKVKKKLIWTVLFSLVVIYFTLTWGLPTLIGSLSIFKKDSGNKIAETVNATLAPPVLNIPYESTNSAVIDIPGYAAANSKVELYVDDALVQETATQEDGSFIFNSVELNLGTNYIYGKTISSDGEKSLASKGIKLLYSNEKPKLELLEPEDNKQIKGGDKKIRISGKTDPENTVTVNNSVVVLNGDGNFFIEKEIAEGDNTITVIATNKVGNSTQITRKVNYSP